MEYSIFSPVKIGHYFGFCAKQYITSRCGNILPCILHATTCTILFKAAKNYLHHEMDVIMINTLSNQFKDLEIFSTYIKLLLY